MLYASHSFQILSTTYKVSLYSSGMVTIKDNKGEHEVGTFRIDTSVPCSSPRVIGSLFGGRTFEELNSCMFSGVILSEYINL